MVSDNRALDCFSRKTIRGSLSSAYGGLVSSTLGIRLWLWDIKAAAEGRPEALILSTIMHSGWRQTDFFCYIVCGIIVCITPVASFEWHPVIVTVQ